MLRIFAVFLALFITQGFALADPVALDDAELSSVQGGNGIGIQLDFFWNATRDTSNTSTPANNSVPLSTLASCAGTGSPCELALQFANRNGADAGGLLAIAATTGNVVTVSGGTLGGTAETTACVTTCTANQFGQWLVFNNFFEGMRIFSLDLNGGSLASAGSNASYWDPTKFENPSGTCLLAAAGVTCAATLTGAQLTAMNNLNALIFSMPVPTTSFTPGVVGSTEVSAGYNSILLGLNAGRMDVQCSAPSQCNNPAGDATGINTGYLPLYDNGKSFAGLVIGDTASDDYSANRLATQNTIGAPGTFGTPVNVLSMAGIAIRGNAYVFGF